MTEDLKKALLSEVSRNKLAHDEAETFVRGAEFMLGKVHERYSAAAAAAANQVLALMAKVKELSDSNEKLSRTVNLLERTERR